MSKQIRGISLRMDILWRYRSNGTGYKIQQFRQDENFCRVQAGEHGGIHVRQYEAEEKEEGEGKMTNNEYLNSVTGESDTSEIASVKMLLTAINEDWEKGRYVMNRGTYLKRYKAQKEWLDSEVDLKPEDK